MISQCPNCKTRFVVSEAQLNAASGNVRCGSCMKVFFAADNQADTEAASDSATESQINETTDIQADADIENIIESQNQNVDTDQFNGQASSAEQNTELEPSNASAKEITNDWLNQLLPEKSANLNQQSEADTEHPVDGDSQQNDLDNNGSNPVTEDLDEYNQSRLYEDGRIEPSMQTIDSVEALNRIETQPVEIAAHDERALASVGGKLHKVIGAALCVVMLLLLSGQWMLNHPDDFQNHPRWQGAYQWVCKLSQCTPAISANDYQTQSLMVYDHPERDNALIVETVIFNANNNSLPFPLIELLFTDAAGNTKAYRRFTASEYLHGELLGVDEMAAATPIHIALEIKDPGADAVNYTVKLIAPNT
jgi:predicted Zn finger-like uncharacterized protein